MGPVKAQFCIIILCLRRKVESGTDTEGRGFGGATHRAYRRSRGMWECFHAL